MSRYLPTPDEIRALCSAGWSVDEDGWWWPEGECGYGRTYHEARREQDRRERARDEGGGRS